MRIEWGNAEKTLIRWTFEKTDTMALTLDAFKEFRAMAESVSHLTFTIIDFRDAGVLPARNTVTAFPQMAKLLPERSKWSEAVAVVSRNQFINSLMQIFGRMYYPNFAFFTDMQAAEVYIAEKMATNKSTQPEAKRSIS